MTLRGVPARPDEILVTHGAQQALQLVAKLFIQDGDLVAIESPTYVPAIQAFELQHAAFYPLERSQHGLAIERLRRLNSESVPRLLYVIPTGHNPTGHNLDATQRRELAGIIAGSHMLVMEDDAYGEINYELPQILLKAQKELARQTLYIGTFSKILSPGLRVGWIAAPTEIIRQLALIKQASDLQTGSLVQVVLSAYLQRNSLESHIAECVNFYRARRDCMASALKAHFPAEATWHLPAAGFSIWVELPAHISADELLKDAIAVGVAFEPGRPFFPVAKPLNFLRLSFSNQSCDRIDQGIARLGNLLKRHNSRPSIP